MSQIKRSLDAISTGYTVFEKDQVLTHEQLNALGSYLDDQERLTRVALLGAGVACGLRAALAGGSVTLSAGVGVTTDGDLVWVGAPTIHDRYKAYDANAPAYSQFFVGETRIPLFELVRQGEDDPGAFPLEEMAGREGRSPGDMAAILFVESREKDRDLCSSNDCDNLGKSLVHTTRLLLVDKADAARLKGTFQTADAAGRDLPEVLADRAAITAFSTVNGLFAAYRAACGSIDAKLREALPAVWPACSWFLAGDFGSDPTAEWLAELARIAGGFAVTGAGIQYYYDFLKDVVETYNAFREALFGEVTVCGPDPAAFPKHLVLGGLSAETSTDHRTAFYPSPARGGCSERLAHARSLARKLSALIHSFAIPALGQLTLRITPSLFEDRALEDRAIPFYYDVTRTPELHRAWSHALEQRGASAGNYSFHAGQYGGVTSPLSLQIGRYPFFRIEGHQGFPVESVKAALEAEIKGRNLPIAVRAIRLGTVVKLPRKRRYTDLHRLHYLLRQDVIHELDEVETFSAAFKGKIDHAIDTKVVPELPAEAVGLSVKETAQLKNAHVKTTVAAAKQKLASSYSEYKKDTTWKTDVGETMKTAAEFKYQLGKVVKTEFATPFDSIIGNRQLLWLDWLDRIIQDKEDKIDDRLTFAKYLAEHPGLEHFAGVTRGGTFVLVHDAGGTVVADFMLPYLCCGEDDLEEEVEEPPLPKPPIKPPFVIDHGVKILPPVESVIEGKIVVFKGEFEPKIREMVDLQEKYLLNKKLDTSILPGGGVQLAEDPMLDLHMKEAEIRTKKIDHLREKLLDPTLGEEAGAALSKELEEAELGLASTMKSTADYIAKKKLPVAPGTDGGKAATMISAGMSKLTGKTAKETLVKGLTDAGSLLPGSDTQKVFGKLAGKLGTG